MKKATKKKAAKPAPAKKKAKGAKKKTKRKTVKKRAVAKKKTKKKTRGPGRPRKKAGRPRGPRASKTIQLPIGVKTDIDFWSKMITYLNKNKNRSYVIQLDGKNYYLSAE